MRSAAIAPGELPRIAATRESRIRLVNSPASCWLPRSNGGCIDATASWRSLAPPRGARRSRASAKRRRISHHHKHDRSAPRSTSRSNSGHSSVDTKTCATALMKQVFPRLGSPAKGTTAWYRRAGVGTAATDEIARGCRSSFSWLSGPALIVCTPLGRQLRCAPHVSAGGTPRAVHSSTPQLLNSSTPQLLNSSTPQLLNSSTPQLLNSSTPRLLVSDAPEAQFCSPRLRAPRLRAGR